MRPDAVETVLLDAGGVLLDLDYSYLKRLIEARRIEVEVEALSRAEVAARSEINRHVAEGGRVSEVWRDYFHLILNQVGVPTELHEAMIDSLWSAHERFGLWTVAIPGGPEAVQAMKDSGLRIGVVSNAEFSRPTNCSVVDFQNAAGVGIQWLFFRLRTRRPGVANGVQSLKLFQVDRCRQGHQSPARSLARSLARQGRVAAWGSSVPASGANRTAPTPSRKRPRVRPRSSARHTSAKTPRAPPA